MSFCLQTHAKQNSDLDGKDEMARKLSKTL